MNSACAFDVRTDGNADERHRSAISRNVGWIIRSYRRMLITIKMAANEKLFCDRYCLCTWNFRGKYGRRQPVCGFLHAKYSDETKNVLVYRSKKGLGAEAAEAKGGSIGVLTAYRAGSKMVPEPIPRTVPAAAALQTASARSVRPPAANGRICSSRSSETRKASTEQAPIGKTNAHHERANGSFPRRRLRTVMETASTSHQTAAPRNAAARSDA